MTELFRNVRFQQGLRSASFRGFDRRAERISCHPVAGTFIGNRRAVTAEAVHTAFVPVEQGRARTGQRHQGVFKNFRRRQTGFQFAAARRVPDHGAALFHTFQQTAVHDARNAVDLHSVKPERVDQGIDVPPDQVFRCGVVAHASHAADFDRTEIFII